MGGEVINLRQARKQKARAEKDRLAEQNRLTFGRSKAEKTLTQTLNEKEARRLDQGRLDRPEDAKDE